MRIEFPAWVAPHAACVQQKFTLLSQAAAETRDKVLAVAVRFFLSLATTIYSLFYPGPSDDVKSQEPPLPKPVIPDGTFPSMQQQAPPLEATDRKDSIPPGQQIAIVDSLTPPLPTQEEQSISFSGATNQPASSSLGQPEDTIAATLAANLLDVTKKPPQSPQLQRVIPDSPTFSPQVPPPTPVTNRHIQQAPIPLSQPLSPGLPLAPSNPFLDLPITEKEKEAISAFMKKSAEVHFLKALTLVPESEKIKKDYGHIHTLRSMAHFITTPETKEHLRIIMNNSIKRAGYMNDLKGRMDNLMKTRKKDIDPYLPGFCEFVKADIKQVESLLTAKNHEEFIRYLLALK